MEPVSFPNMMGMGPIRITPPVLTSPVLDAVPCRNVPMNIRMKPIKIAMIPNNMMLLPLIITDQQINSFFIKF